MTLVMRSVHAYRRRFNKKTLIWRRLDFFWRYVMSTRRHCSRHKEYQKTLLYTSTLGNDSKKILIEFTEYTDTPVQWKYRHFAAKSLTCTGWAADHG